MPVGFGSVFGTRMILGTGKMGEACVRHLCKKSAGSVLVSNRSFERAETLAAEIGAAHVRFDSEAIRALAITVLINSEGGRR